MKVELVSVGTELLQGKLNAGAAKVCETLASLGINLERTTISPDSVDVLKKILSESFKRSSLVIVTGGLPPHQYIGGGGLGSTSDDITVKAVAQVLKKKLTFSRVALENIARYFTLKGEKVPSRVEKQAYVIDGAELIPNRLGTAVGQIILSTVQRQPLTVILLPGPPQEMEVMLQRNVVLFLKERFERGFRKRIIIHTSGLSEQAVFSKIAGLIETERRLEGGEIKFGILTLPGIVDVKITVHGTNEMIVDEVLHKARNEVVEVLKENIFGENEATLASVVGRLLGKRHKTLAIAESCTGGLLSKMITDIPGSSLYFQQGVVTYSRKAKIELLEVKDETLKKSGDVSEECAREMAEGVRRKAGTNIGISITGITGPGGGTKAKPIGLTFIGVATEKQTKVWRFRFAGNRKETREWAANTALDILRRELK